VPSPSLTRYLVCRCSDPKNGFATHEDFTGGQNQQLAALAMDKACKGAGCQFIVSTGDNFYECGLDNPARWESDFYQVYKNSSRTPSIAPLRWYNVIGNHDIIDNSTQIQIDYTKSDPSWVAGRNFAWEVHSKDSSVRVRFTGIYTNSLVTKYGKANYKYNTSEWRANSSPQNISDMMAFLNTSLSTSRANYDIVIGHHPLMGTTSCNGYNGTAYSPEDAGACDMGRPDASGTPGWAKLLSTLRAFNPAAYFNGHDHALGIAKDPAFFNSPPQTSYGTQYVTSGAGSAPDSACLTAVYRKYLYWSGAAGSLGNGSVNVTSFCPWVARGTPLGPNYNLTDASESTPSGDLGFNIVTVTARSMKIDFYLSTNGYPVKAYSTYTPIVGANKRPKPGCNC
jgi:hypothetical protein